MARLVVSSGGARRAVPLAEGASIGRHIACTVVLDDEATSKRHCEVERRHGAYVLRDLGSLNGTFVNGRPVVDEHVLRDGDEITVGDSTLRFEDVGAPSLVGPAPAAAPVGVPLARIRLRRKTPPPRTSTPHRARTPLANAAWRAGSGPRRASATSRPAPRPPQPPPPPASAPPSRPTDRPPGGPARQLTVFSPAAVPSTRPPGLSPWAPPAPSPGDPPAASPRPSTSADPSSRALLALLRTLALEHDVPALLASLLRGLVDGLPIERGALFAPGPDGALVARVLHARGGASFALAVSTTLLEATALRGVPAFVEGSRAQPGALSGPAVVVPIGFEGDAIGVLWLEASAGSPLGVADLEIVEIAVSHAAALVVARRAAPRAR